MKILKVCMLAAAISGFGVQGAVHAATSHNTSILITIQMHARNGSKMEATATISFPPFATGRGATVTILVKGIVIPEASYPAGIYAGLCRDAYPKAPVVKLNPVRGGRSHSIVPLKGWWGQNQQFSVAILSESKPHTLSCGDHGR
jgi:hypothetical protein